MSIIIDFFIATLVLLTTLLGIRDGLVRKLITTLVLIAAMVVGQLMTQDIASILVDEFGFDPATAPTWGMFFLVCLFLATGSAIYRFVAKNYKIGGLADRIAGGTIGFAQGVILVSFLLTLMTRHGVPGPEVRKDARLYGPVVNVAPQIMDMAGESAPEALEELQRRAIPEVLKKEKLLDDVGKKLQQESSKEKKPSPGEQRR
ncbi:MAG TPA: CvpA family protein [Bacteroidota bacterium]|nr:CvpA family protein [Bacteroidota bacterium]